MFDVIDASALVHVLSEIVAIISF